MSHLSSLASCTTKAEHQNAGFSAVAGKRASTSNAASVGKANKVNQIECTSCWSKYSKVKTNLGMEFPPNQPIPPYHPMSSHVIPMSAHLGHWPLLHPPSFPAQLSAAVEPGYMAPPVRAKRPCRRPPRPAVTEITNAAKNRNVEDIWYMINDIID